MCLVARHGQCKGDPEGVLLLCCHILSTPIVTVHMQYLSGEGTLLLLL